MVALANDRKDVRCAVCRSEIGAHTRHVDIRGFRYVQCRHCETMNLAYSGGAELRSIYEESDYFNKQYAHYFESLPVQKKNFRRYARKISRYVDRQMRIAEIGAGAATYSRGSSEASALEHRADAQQASSDAAREQVEVDEAISMLKEIEASARRAMNSIVAVADTRRSTTAAVIQNMRRA